MNKKNSILSMIKKHNNGVSLAQLLNEFPEFPRRSAQRWIQELIKSGEIMAQGQGPSRLYFPIKEAMVGDIFPNTIPLTTSAREILQYVNQPQIARKPVGYQSDFLESYEPNKSFYLSTSLRRQLSNMGEMNKADLHAGTYGREILNRLLIDLSWASSNLEGNTYSLLDTRMLIEQGKVAEGKAAIETQMILNHKAAIELLLENVSSIDFNRYTLQNLHSVLSENLLPNPADEGRLRQHSVFISKSVYTPLSIPQKIDDMFMLMMTKAQKIKDPFEQAFFAMVHIPYLQPFADVNKRTSRLAANIPLFKNNLCPLTFLDVSASVYSRSVIGVYELTRVELLRDLFVWAYERSTQTYISIQRNLAEPDPLRLQYRDIIKTAIRQVVLNINLKPLEIIQKAMQGQVTQQDEAQVTELIMEELKRLHEGVLTRYGLSQGEYQLWKEAVRGKPW